MSSSRVTVAEKTLKLYNALSVEDIATIQEHFRQLKSSGLSYERFRSLLGQFDIAYSDDVFQNVCLKIDLDRDNAINWSEFIAYFILELQNDDNMSARLSIMLPIPKPAMFLPTTNKNIVSRILNTGGSETSDCNYVTIECYGDLYFWTTAKWRLEMHAEADELPETSSSTIELYDKRQIKKSSKTLILDAVVLSDLQIICISSVCCDLRFYDISSSKCNLRLYVKNFSSPLNALYYRSSRLIIGDRAGSVYVLNFAMNFKRKLREVGSVIRQITYRELMKGEYDTIDSKEFINIHNDVVRQVFFSESLNSFISASESTITKSAYLPSVIIGNLGSQDARIVFTMNSGTTCFAFDESSRTLATGGPDTFVRLWNPTTPESPTAIFGGHNSGITMIFMQDGTAKIYSMDKSKIIKIWDGSLHQLLQTFTGFKTMFPSEAPLTAIYNDASRELIVASKKLASVKCNPKINLDETDGYSDISSILVILLNKLFNFLVTCSESSTIMVWDVWNGRKVNIITKAHTRIKHGEVQLVPIASGCFDPKHQFLLTAAEDTLKVWNFNEGFCLRTIRIDGASGVNQVCWATQRIFAFCHSVVEFTDENNCKQQINMGKTWRECHDGDIICASVLEPYAVVTSCTAGELIFWRFETGAPYLRFNVNKPSHKLPVVYNRTVEKIKESSMKTKKNKISESLGESHLLSEMTLTKEVEHWHTAQCMLSLNSRTLHVSNGTLLVSLTSGRIQVWPHHQNTSSYITDFTATHVAGDVITAMTTDSQNFYLFTGSSRGYIKTWMIVNFCLSTAVAPKISQVKLRKLFPFLLRDDLEGRAKRSVKKQCEPQLLNSYQGHRKSINGLIFSQDNEILISASSDKSVRLWHLSGQYIGTIGSPIDWRCPSPNKPPPYDYSYRFPADLKHVISHTTMKVLEGGNVPPLHRKEMMDKEVADDFGDTASIDATKQYQRIIRQPSSKKDVKDDVRRRYDKPTLDISLPHIPVYSHLRIHPTVAINLPRSIPKCLETNNLPNLQYAFLEPNDSKTE